MQLFTTLGVLTALTVTSLILADPAKARAAPPNFHVSLTLYFANGTSSNSKWFEDDSALPEKTPGSILQACRAAGDRYLAVEPDVVDYSCSLTKSN